jgi:hypothetical protein
MDLQREIIICSQIYVNQLFFYIFREIWINSKSYSVILLYLDVSSSAINEQYSSMQILIEYNY